MVQVVCRGNCTAVLLQAGRLPQGRQAALCCMWGTLPAAMVKCSSVSEGRWARDCTFSGWFNRGQMGCLPQALSQGCGIGMNRPAVDIGSRYFGDKGVQLGRAVALQVWHAGYEPRPQTQQVVDTAARPMPGIQRVDSELSHQADPVLVVLHTHLQASNIQ